MPDAPPDYSPGDQFSARWLNRVLAYLRSLWLTSDGSILFTETPSGREARVNLPQRADFRITGGANPYGGVEQWAIAGGAWQDEPGGRTVTTAQDPLYERGANAAVAVGTVVRAERDVHSGAWIFDRRACAKATVATPSTPPAPTSPPAPTTPSPGPPSTPPAPAPTPPTRPDDPVPPSSPTAPPDSPIPPTPTPWPQVPPISAPSPGEGSSAYPGGGPGSPAAFAGGPFALSAVPLPTGAAPAPIPKGVDAIQTLVQGGTYPGTDITHLVFGGQTTGTITMGATAAAIQSAFAALSSVGSGNAMVNVPVAGTWVVTFVGSLGRQAVGPITIGLTTGGDTITVTQTQIGHP